MNAQNSFAQEDLPLMALLFKMALQRAAAPGGSSDNPPPPPLCSDEDRESALKDSAEEDLLRLVFKVSRGDEELSRCLSR